MDARRDVLVLNERVSKNRWASGVMRFGYTAVSFTCTPGVLFEYTAVSFTCTQRVLFGYTAVFTCTPRVLFGYTAVSFTCAPGVLFDNVDWQWAYKVYKYSTPSLYALICSSASYMQYMYDALCSYCITCSMETAKKQNQNNCKFAGFCSGCCSTHYHMRFYLMFYMWFLWNVWSNRLYYTV